MRTLVVLAACALTLASGRLVAAAELAGSRIVVEAGKQDRINVPVRVHLGSGTDTRSPIALKSADGTTIPVQVSDDTATSWTSYPPLSIVEARARVSELDFVLAALKAGKKSTFEVVAVPQRAEPQFSWHDTPGKFTELRFGDRPVLRYMYEPYDTSSPERRRQTFKVYHHVFNPAGTQLLTKGDTGGLYPHHRGLFYGYRQVTYDGNQHVDIWHCPNAYQLHKRFETIEAGPVLGRQVAEIDWNDIKKKTFAVEHREVTAYNVPGGTLIDFVSRLVPTHGTVKLDGDSQHSGFHFRAAQEVAASTKGQTYYLRPDSKGKPGETRDSDPKHPDSEQSRLCVNLPWDAMSFVVGGKRYTVLYMDHPDNPKPTRYSERNYGRFGSFFPAEITPEKPLVIRYRIWVQEGEMTGQQAAAMTADFDHPVRATLVSK